MVAARACAIAETFERWNEGPLKSYLIEISGKVSAAEDAASGGPLIDVILDRAGQKGTGRWTVIEAQQAGAPVPGHRGRRGGAEHVGGS